MPGGWKASLGGMKGDTMRTAILVLMLVLTAVSPYAQRTLDLRIEGDQIPAKFPAVVGQPMIVTGNVGQ